MIVLGTREGDDIGLFLRLFPKFYNNDFLFVGSTTMGTWFTKTRITISMIVKLNQSESCFQGLIREQICA